MIQSPEQINEIAEQLECGFLCYIHKQTKEVLFVPDTNRYPDMDIRSWKKDIVKIEKNYAEYIAVEPLETRQSFKIMERFAESIDDNPELKNRLFWALSNPNPFRNFKYEIDYSGTHRQKWFDFKHESLKEWVLESINDME